MTLSVHKPWGWERGRHQREVLGVGRGGTIAVEIAI